MFDERGRTFKLADNANLNPLDVMLPPGETVPEDGALVHRPEKFAFKTTP